MAYRLRSEKELRDTKTLQKRASISEESQLKEMTDTILRELQRMQEKQEMYQKIAQEQMADFRREIKTELKGMKQEIEGLNQELKELKIDKIDLQNSHERLQGEVRTLDSKTTKLEVKQEWLESKELEYQLRFRNVWEDVKENIRKIITEIIADSLQCTIEEADDRTDRIYRINTNYARRNKTPRDIIVNFTKKIFRDEMLKANNEHPIYKGKRIVVLKEYPTETLNRRRKYLFLVDELKKQNLRFRWEKAEGLMTTYKGQKHWITSEGKAENFYKKIKKDREERGKEDVQGKVGESEEQEYRWKKANRKTHLISNKEIDNMIMMGDFNGVLNYEIDKNPGKGHRKKTYKGTLPKDLQNLKEEYNLVDIWRLHHEGERDYTFFSERHKIYSDHCPLELTLNQNKNSWRWRLDSNLLKKKEDIETNRKLLEEFFTINNNQETPPNIIWDASKATMRGYLIQQGARKKRERQEQLNLIVGKIIQLEKELKVNPKNQKILKELKLYQKKREFLELEQRANQLKFVKQNYFENANKPGRWLSRKLRRKKEATYINKIKLEDKIYVTEKEILNQFLKFYSKLYEKDEVEKENISKYLGKLYLQKIKEEDRERLNKEISGNEIQKAIKKLDGTKSPGPDGISAIYYKTFEKELTPHLQKIMNLIREVKNMPDSWKEALITVIHKENTDQEDIKNYRPISLLNVDYKIFSSIMADRLKNFLENWINQDQTGFLPNRQIKDNVRMVINLIDYYEKNIQREVLFIAIDAEKAFDRVNWDFFKLLAQELDMGHYFRNSLEAIYQNQNAKIRINGQETKLLNIEKGTRQGCPLSPLIFIMTLEILLTNIRDNKELQGANITYKVKAYADDIICFVENPMNTGEKWMEVIKQFGALAGLKINLNKTKALAKNISKRRQEIIANQLGIQLSTKLKYLGIILTSKNIQLLQNNYLKTWNEIKKDLDRWKNLKISLWGRISTIKMNILPRMLYLFQCLPILRNQKNFINWNKDLSKYIWQGKKPRIKMQNLTDDRNRGGFAAPNLKIYYEACNLIWIKDWIQLRNRKILNIEGFDLWVGWHSYLWYERTKIEKNFYNHPIRSALIKTWQKYKTRMYSRTPKWISPLEAVQRRLMGWNSWPKYEDLLKKQGPNWILKSHQELLEGKIKVSWLQYGQLREYFKRDGPIGFMDKNNLWDRVLFTDEKLISKIYKILLEWETETNYIKNCMTKWSKNIARPILLEEWEACWIRKLKLTYALELKENWMKLFYRWYMTPKKLGYINKNLNTNCWKCGREEGGFYHLWWKCCKAREYWTMIHNNIQKILEAKFIQLPETYLLGISKLQAGSNDEKLMIFLTTAARIVYARHWRQKEVPTKTEWLVKVLEIKNMDRLTFLLAKQKGTPRTETMWQQVDRYINKNKYIDIRINKQTIKHPKHPTTEIEKNRTLKGTEESNEDCKKRWTKQNPSLYDASRKVSYVFNPLSIFFPFPFFFFFSVRLL
uniref:Reverse transcriptase domain-containing protein n=1 Tax=Anolis carolinensis TaxID=28377 RepID=A0A803SPA4_ANOCA